MGGSDGPEPDDAPDDSGAPVREISGVGATYAERLAEQGVETVADLAAADPDELADRTGIARTRLRGWIDSAAATLDADGDRDAGDGDADPDAASTDGPAGEDRAPLSDLAGAVRGERDPPPDRDAGSDGADGDAAGDDGDGTRREYSLFDRPEIDVDPGGEREFGAGGDAGAEAGDGTGPEERAPLSEIADRIERRRSEPREADAAEAEMFEEVEVDDVDGEQVWETLLSGSAAEEVETGTGGAVGAGAQAERVGTREDAPEFVVPKEKFCERCPYLSDPPELACEHEGTSIVAVVDSENFRVRDCPFAGEEMPDFGGQFDDIE